MSKTGLRWSFMSDVGVLRKANQDAAMANGMLFVVADGMGGHRGGEVASQVVTDHFTAANSITTVEELREAVVASNATIRKTGAADPELLGMGTTVVAMAILPADEPSDPLRLAAANVGDSRLYLFEQGELSQISVDHSLVSELVRAGQISEAEAAIHPQRNVVTRALGPDDNVEVDTWELPARLGQRYLLCSDGLVNEVEDKEIAAILADIDDPTAAASRLVDMANKSGGRDNITVLILDILDPGEVEPGANAAEGLGADA